mmetsp:Transcript_35137/g.98653  ORF Transcript_35137/g.98653 Transcript_35137/m.98653 type:complete len:283 (-) Transcript_35137:660-1508(-)
MVQGHEHVLGTVGILAYVARRVVRLHRGDTRYGRRAVFLRALHDHVSLRGQPDGVVLEVDHGVHGCDSQAAEGDVGVHHVRGGPLRVAVVAAHAQQLGARGVPEHEPLQQQVQPRGHGLLRVGELEVQGRQRDVGRPRKVPVGGAQPPLGGLAGSERARHRDARHEAVKQERGERQAGPRRVDHRQPVRRRVVEQVHVAHFGVVHEELVHAIVDGVASLLRLAPRDVLRARRAYLVEGYAALARVADHGVGRRMEVEGEQRDLQLLQERVPQGLVAARQRRA